VNQETLARHALRLLAGVTLSLSALAALAAWPSKPIQIVVGFSPGGSADVLARALAESMSRTLKQSVVVVNREGAAGTIAMAATAKADDSHTFGFGPAGPLVLQPHVKSLPYKASDVVGVCQTFVNNYALVAAPNSKYKTLRDVLNDPRAKSDGVPFGTGGLGSVPHLAAVELGLQSGSKLLAVPYRGDPPVALALKAGEIELGTVSVGLAQTQALRILGVFSPTRLPDAPDAPTMKEQGVPVVAQLFGGLYAPKTLPPDVLRALEGACRDAAHSEHYLQVAKSSQQDVVYRDGAAFSKAIEGESKAFAGVIRKANLKLN
jgi:tripartite-type tricarboxylate transporter receptor subunit TctC